MTDHYGYANLEKCPKCYSDKIKKIRIKYVFANDSNPIDCKCLECGYKWEERD